MKTFQEFLEENLNKLGALKTQLKKTSSSRSDLAGAERDLHHGDTDYDDAKDYYNKTKKDHESNVQKTQNLVKQIKKHPEGSEHIKDMIKKGKERSQSKRTNVDRLARNTNVKTKKDLVSSGKRKGKLTVDDQNRKKSWAYSRLNKYRLKDD